jgi:hypothetical protein
MDASMDERSARLANNEAIFRAGNERIDAMSPQDDEVAYLCECGDDACFERVVLQHEEYESVRAHSARFFVIPGHEDLTAGEVVVQELPRYTVVEKQGGEREIVEAADPRSQRP